jgi:3-deoxy-D-manno-octulosonate 8-phosphate phosphatase (KDO 8-P phosphatase)
VSLDSELGARFSKLGGTFLTPPAELAERLEAIRGLVFDWDGVFNAGAKGDGVASTFTEADSMGTNLLRYALWRRERQLPIAAVVTGVDNPSARGFALREHFHAVFQGAKNKGGTLAELCSAHELTPRELICVFDDVNDLGMAAGCGVRVLVRRDASPLLQEYVAREGICDYITGQPGQGYAVRELCELLLGLMDCFDSVVAARGAWDDDYRSYFSARQGVRTELFDLTRHAAS